MGIQADRSDIESDKRTEAKNKKNRLIIQRNDLLLCINQIFDNAQKGKAYYKIYRQFKMYNDPSMNPYLSGLIK